MKKAGSLLVICLCLGLCGCASMVKKHEITDLAIVMAVGLDACGDGKLCMSLLVQSSSDKEGSRLYSETGETLVECLQLLTEACERIPFFGHTEMVFIGESFWEEDALARLDWFVRSSRLRQECTVNAVKNTSAADFLKESLSSAVFVTDAVKAIYESESLFRLSADSRVSVCMRSRAESVWAPVIPCLEISALADGSFVPRLSCYLILCEGMPLPSPFAENEAAAGLHLLWGEAQGMHLPARDDRGASVMTEIRSSACDIQMESIDPLQVCFTVKVQYHIPEYYGQQDPTDPSVHQSISRSLEETVRSRCREALHLLSQGGADALGLSQQLRRHDPAAYAALEPQWRQVIREAEFSVRAEAAFIHSNQLGRPLGAGEGS